MKKETSKQKKIAEFIHLLMYTNRLHNVLMEDEIADLGIHVSQHHMLAIIAANKSICQKDIAKKLDISSAAVAVTLNRLASLDLITRTQSFDDARMNHISITEKGQELLKNSKQALAVMDEKFFEGISEEEISQVNEILKKIGENAGPNAEAAAAAEKPAAGRKKAK